MKKRILFLDYARVITAFLVVYGHLYPISSTVRLYIYAFHMPLFFLISGFLHSPRTSSNEIKKYFYTLFIPTLFFIFIGILIKVVFFKQNLFHLMAHTFKSVCIYGNGVVANGIVWFLFALIGVKLLMFLYLKIKPPKFTDIIFLLGAVLLLYICKKYHVYPFLLRHWLMAFPFYFFGFYVRKYYEKGCFNVLSNRKCIYSFLFLGLLCFLITRINGRVSMLGLSFGHAVFPLNVFFFYLNGIIGSLMIISISFLFKNENQYITLTANSLISILGFQELIIKVVGYHGDDYNYFVSAVVSLLIIIACVFLNWFIMKICPQLLGKT